MAHRNLLLPASIPPLQLTAYVHNQYFITTDGGINFSALKKKNEKGQFINPADYDNTSNILYAGDEAGKYFRWPDPSAMGTNEAEVSVAAFNGAKVTFVLVSPTVANRVYFGLDNGSVV